MNIQDFNEVISAFFPGFYVHMDMDELLDEDSTHYVYCRGRHKIWCPDFRTTMTDILLERTQKADILFKEFVSWGRTEVGYYV